MNGVGVVLEPSPVIPVVVRMESVRPENSSENNRGLGSFSARNGFPVNMQLESTAVSLNRQTYWPQNQNKNLGYSFSNVEAGKYDFVIGAFEPWYVQSATCGSTDLLRQELEVGTRGQTIDVVLRNDGATISGVVRSQGKSAMGALLMLRDDAPRQIKTSSTSEDGRFVIGGFAPGNYSILAFDHVDDLEYLETETLRDYLPKATHITLQPNQNADVTVDLIQR